MKKTINDSVLISLTQKILREPSITPDPGKCLDIIADFCKSSPFNIRRLDHKDTANLFITTHNTRSFPLLFCGHVDVVPPGNPDLWDFPPFSATIHDQKIFGRGAVDMKSSISAFLCALQTFLLLPNASNLPVALIFTSDEEGPAINGTSYVIERLVSEGYKFQTALVGEPTSTNTVGDTIKIGRRGSLSASITVAGKQSHVAYAKSSENPIFALTHFIHVAQQHMWDTGHALFPPTQFCATNFESTSGASNVTPSHASCKINFRFCPASSVQNLQQQVNQLLSETQLPFKISWSSNSSPFYKPAGPLCQSITRRIQSKYGINSELSTSGGTSDARFIAPHVEEILEFGPLNHTAHQINEHIALSDLYILQDIYYEFLKCALKTQANNLADP